MNFSNEKAMSDLMQVTLSELNFVIFISTSFKRAFVKWVRLNKELISLVTASSGEALLSDGIFSRNCTS